jgi:hypothetical protein
VAFVSVVALGGAGLWLIFLAAIGFHHRIVPSAALDRIAGRPEVIRWLDEATLGISVEIVSLGGHFSAGWLFWPAPSTAHTTSRPTYGPQARKT